MDKYVKPTVVVMDDCAEGVYSASGVATSTPECDSKYMGGKYHHYEGGWDKTVKDFYGCIGCPAYREEGCALKVDKAYRDGAKSYDTDKGKRKPTWEKMGKHENHMVNDKNGVCY